MTKQILANISKQYLEKMNLAENQLFGNSE